MKIRGTCQGCRKGKWFIRKRTYRARPLNETVTSNGELCGKCFRKIKKLIK